MTDEELSLLVSELESDRVERKSSISDGEKIREAVCAFANDMPNHQLPGVVIVGVDDQGNCANLVIDDRLLLTLAAIRDDGNILPIPRMQVEKRVLNGCAVAVVLVHPSPSPPVRYKGNIWIRVGPRRAKASEDEERTLRERRRARDLPYDMQGVSTASLDDLDLQFFSQAYLPAAVSREALEANNRTVEQQLQSLRFMTAAPPEIPTVAAVLVLGKSPADYIPGAYVQFLRIDGSDLSDPIIDEKELHGPLPQILRQLDELLHLHVHTSVDLTTDAVERRSPDYPVVALQQYVRNAAMHRNYESSNAPIRITWFRDRVEIHSPGGPFGQVREETFGQPGITDYRNPNLAESMKVLGYVQRFGVGLAVAREALRKNGNPSPKFQTSVSFVSVTVAAREAA